MNHGFHSPEGLSTNQTVLLTLLIGFSLGTVGLLALALMVWFSQLRFGVDRSAKHGISVRNTSRLGGLAIALFLMMVWVLSYLSRAPGVDFDLVVPFVGFPTLFWPVLLVGMVGLADDIGVSVKPSVRLLVMLGIGLMFFLLEPEALPNRLLEILNIENHWSIFVLTAASSVLLTGFVNAANIADGANGLLAGLCLVFFWVVWQLQGNEWLFYLLVILLCFWLINILTGRILLGDFGAYTLGVLVVLLAFNLFDEQGVSVFFLASLLCYPCVEILRIMCVRRCKGQSPLLADNTHLHNLLNEKLRDLLPGNTLPNSMTGMLIVLITSLPGILIFKFGFHGDTAITLVAFSLQATTYMWLWVRLERA